MTDEKNDLKALSERIPSLIRQPKPPQSLTNTAVESRHLQRAKTVVLSILGRYPDFGKCPPEYMIGLVELVATYPDEMQDAFADIRKGISSRTKFLPTAAEFVAMGDEIEAYKAKWAVPSRPVREPDTEEYNPSVVSQYFDKRGNRMTEREFMVHAEQVYASKRIQQEQDRMQAYAKHIGNGSTERGWQIMMDMGMTAVPADFVPPVKEEAQ